MTKKELRSVVDNAEKVFEACWETIAELKYGTFKKGTARKLFEFQPQLAKALFHLEHAYNKLRGQEKRSARERKTTSKEVSRRNLLSKRQRHALNDLIDIGKILGDSFAWLFYQNERALLRRHYEHVFIPRVATGTGGQGEITFLENSPKFGSYLVVYHGTTTFLRLGDISLIDLENNKVVAIGELKSHKLSATEISIKVNLIGSKLKKTLLPKPIGMRGSAPDAPELKPEQIARLQRQVSAIKKSFSADTLRNMGSAPDMCVEWNIEKLNSLYRASTVRKFYYIKADRGLLLAGVKLGRASFWRAFASGRRIDFDSKMGEIGKNAIRIVDNTIPDNSVTIGSLLNVAHRRYCLTHGMRPLAWWPITRESAKDLIFRRFLVTTFFNPAFLLKDLRDGGLLVSCKNGSCFEITKLLRNQLLKFEGFDYFIDLIEHYLFPEASVAQLVLQTFRSLEGKAFAHPSRVQLNVNFEFV